MARKKKSARPKKFSATKAVKAAAREQIGTVPPTRAVPEKTKKSTTRHKPTLGKIIEELTD
jgi:hypothetical protein